MKKLKPSAHKAHSQRCSVPRKRRVPSAWATRRSRTAVPIWRFSTPSRGLALPYGDRRVRRRAPGCRGSHTGPLDSISRSGRPRSWAAGAVRASGAPGCAPCLRAERGFTGSLGVLLGSVRRRCSRAVARAAVDPRLKRFDLGQQVIDLRLLGLEHAPKLVDHLVGVFERGRRIGALDQSHAEDTGASI